MLRACMIKARISHLGNFHQYIQSTNDAVSIYAFYMNIFKAQLVSFVFMLMIKLLHIIVRV